MAILHSHTIIFSLCLMLFHLHFSLSSTYTLPPQYFINCGSSSLVTINDRNFTGDTNSGLLSTPGEILTNTNPSTNPSLYQTARRFKKPSTYTLQISQKGYYMVRFHFYPFLNLSDAQFNVSASTFTLLSNFNVSKNTNSPIIKEFLLTINTTKLFILFSPSNPNSFAFVNAIEAFIAPEENFKPNPNQKDILSHVLHTIHRINVGGAILTPYNDTLLRNWVPDDDYLYSNLTAKNARRDTKPKYQQGGANEFTAPDNVYQTAKQLNTDNGQKVDTRFNVTWRFSVTKNASHFVRAHFCDIVSQTQVFGKFYFFIDGKLGAVIDPNTVYTILAAPFYKDVTVDSDDSGFMNVSIGPDADSTFVTPFLNGLEIMEIMTDLSSVVLEPMKNHHNRMLVIVGSIVGGMVCLILLLAVLFWFKWKKREPVDKFDQSLVLLNGGNYSYGTVSSRTVGASPRTILNLGLKLNLDDIFYATNKFDPKLMIGEGGFGKVYKGTLRNGVKVAVKRSEPGHGQGLYEFETEIIVLSKIRHIHLVSLIGYCDESSEMILVYEYIVRKWVDFLPF